MPTGEQWGSATSRSASGVVARGVVLSHHPFGFFVDLGGNTRSGMDMAVDQDSYDRRDQVAQTYRPICHER
jgi:hypothetical protein